MKEKKERKNLFTVEYLKSQLAKNPINFLFEETKLAYRADKIFEDSELINLRSATVEGIVKKLESYNLSETSEDVKGIAFERFLGGTFRGEIGQFFTPRPVVEFIVKMLDPQEDERICAPASGSGGFLIRCFEIIREAIAADVDAQYRAFCEVIDKKKGVSLADKAKAKRDEYKKLQQQLDPYSDPDKFVSDKMRSRIWRLSNLCIYGTDANDRMARTSKMNMTEIDRWSLGYIRQASGNLVPEGGRYSVVRLGDVVSDLSNGWSPQCFARPAEENEWGVLKLGAVSFGSFNDKENKALPPSLKADPVLEVRVGDVLISRANIPRLVGACAHVTCTRPKLLLCDKIFRVVFKPDSAIAPEYIAEVMKLPHLRRQIESSVTGSSPTMRNITKPALLALRIPLPPLSIQKRLVAEVTAAREQIAAERAAAEKLAADTAREVEEMILGRLPVSICQPARLV